MKKNNDNLFEINKDKIYPSSAIVDDKYRRENPDDIYTDVFSYKNITLEYDFSTGASSIYLEKSKDTYELVYQSSVNDSGLESSSLFSKDSAFLLYGYNPSANSIYKLYAISKADFIKLFNLISNTDNKFIFNIRQLLAGYHTALHSTTLISEDNYCKNKDAEYLLKDYKTLFVKYKMSSMLIPCFCILDDVISSINSYIATSTLNNEFIEKSIRELQSFKEVCPESLKLLTNFIGNPKSMDLRMLCDSLQKNLNNINNLINLYLKDDLVLDEKEK